MALLIPAWRPSLITASIANDLAGSAGAASTSFEITVIGVRRDVRTSHGLSVPAVPVTRCGRPDVVLLPALGAKMPETLQEALERPDVTDAGGYLREWAHNDVLIGAACTGTFVLADPPSQWAKRHDVLVACSLVPQALSSC